MKAAVYRLTVLCSFDIVHLVVYKRQFSSEFYPFRRIKGLVKCVVIKKCIAFIEEKIAL